MPAATHRHTRIKQARIVCNNCGLRWGGKAFLKEGADGERGQAMVGSPLNLTRIPTNFPD
jgi:hypothetical protein